MSLKLILKSKKFAPMFWTQFCGALNDNFYKNALVLLITYRGVELWGQGSTSLVAMAGGIFILPFFIFSATAGQLADNFQKATIVRITKITELLIMAVGSIGLFIDNFYLLMLVLFLMGTQSAFFGPLKYGIIPSLVEKRDLVSANALVGAGTFIAILIGTILGGLSVSLISSTTGTIVGILFFALLGIIASRKVTDVPLSGDKGEIDLTFFRSTFDILKITMKTKNIFVAVLGVSWFWFFGAALLSLIPSMVKEVFFGNETVGTLFLAMFTVGMGVGAFIYERISKGVVDLGTVIFAGIGMSIVSLDLYFICQELSARGGQDLLDVASFLKTPKAFRALFDIFAICTCGGLFIIPQMTYLQKEAAPEVLARTIAGNNIWNAIFMVSCAIGIMVLKGMNFSIGELFLTLGIINIIATGLLFFKYKFPTLRRFVWFFGSLFYDIEVEGQENFPDKGPYVVVANHVSFVDWMILHSVVPVYIRFVIDHIYYFKPLLQNILKGAGLVPIASRRESEEILNKAFNEVSKAIEKGHVIGLFPEGWITRDGQMRRFQPGVRKIVRINPVPVIPVAIDGLWGSYFSFGGKGLLKGLPRLKRRKVVVRVLEPQCPTNINLDEMASLIKNNLKTYPMEKPVEEIF